MINAISVDVEDYFQVSAFEKYIKREDWGNIPSRVEQNTIRILELFNEYNVKGTFFILGWIAQRNHNLIRRIVDNGHEIACHGFSHIRVNQQKPKDFKEDVYRSKSIIEDICGVELKGYRAASYSIDSSNLWALEILDDLGFLYSSSIYPIKHDIYGMPEAPRFVYKPTNTNYLIEIPISTVEIFNKRIPCGGGGFFRLYPYKVTNWAINRVNKIDAQSCIFYFHPWEIDRDQPRQKGLDFKTQFRHYINISYMENKLMKLMKDFKWTTIEDVFLK